MNPHLPKIAYFDIETAPHLIYAWTLYETNAISVVRESYMLSFAVQWEGDLRVKTYALPDFPGYKPSAHDDKKLVTKLWEIMNEADILVAHNGDSFDIKKVNARFIKHGLKPPAPYKSIDTLKIARRVAAFPSNKLDSLAKDLGIGRKLPHTGFHMWEGCMAGKASDWRLMRKYNAHDVDLLRAVYMKLRGWAPTGVDLAVYEGREACPRCGSTDFHARGYFFFVSGKKRRFNCNDCGHWFAEKKKHDQEGKSKTN